MATAVRDAVWRRASTRRRTRRRLSSLLRRARGAEATWLVGLTLLCVVLALFAGRELVPLSSFVVPVLIGGVALSLRGMLFLLAVVTVTLAVLTSMLAVAGLMTLRLGALGVVAATALIMLWNARSRTQLGVAGTRGETMLIDLRDRLLSQGELPDLPRPWYAEAVMRSAGGASFAGDFMVAARAPDGAVLEVAVVDVSGKGLDAGTRALLLSGAFGGLLGSVPAEQFLPAANAYLLRQEWGEGFATAVYLHLNLRTGEFEVRTAGHPPAVQLHAGSGRWAVQVSEGPVLGLLENAEFIIARGRLQAGDALLLYTDGLVETPQRDISLGIDKLLGEAERLATRGFDQGASRLVDRIASQNDDRALVLLHRRVLG
ncbi:MAG TPA: PP2C family protein-serine/threonine phosphatase [Nocardioidaceae bacterium]|nr:PP2C family protein-serine/threonine phosphatase [Nocardioidaceae bacterium]